MEDGDEDVVHISELKPDPENARLHTPRNVGMIVDALQEVGAARSIVIDEDNTVLAGNATVEAAGQVDMTRVRVVEASGNEIIAVRRRGLSEEQKKRLALFDNRANELSAWNTDILKTLSEIDLQKLFLPFELTKLGFDTFENNPRDEWKEMPEFENTPRIYRSITVHFKSENDLLEFSQLINQSIGPEARYIWHPKQVREKELSQVIISDES